MPGIVTIKLGFGNVIKKNSLSLLLVGKEDIWSSTLRINKCTLRKEWLLLYADTKHLIHLDSAPVTIICNDKIIIDNILLYSNNINTLIHYFSCVDQVCTKYRLSFKLTKCDFVKPRVEFDGRDVTTYGNCTTASKFYLIKHWPLPLHTISLLSFIGLSTAEIILGLRRM